MGVNRRQRQESGFILATTLWIVAAVAVLAALFHAYIERQVNEAAALQQRVRDNFAVEATAETLRYLLATRRVTFAGVTLRLEDQGGYISPEGFIDSSPVGGELRLDGTVYQGLGGVRFSIHDLAGQLGLNSPSGPDWMREILTRQLGRQQALELVAALEDYIDENRTRRINGAEAARYQMAGRDEPTNWYLRTTTELENVWGWKALLDSEWGGFWKTNAGVAFSSVVNLNTASPELLSALLYIDEAEAQALIAARNEYPFRSLKGVADALGSTDSRWQEASFRFYPGGDLSFRLWCESCNWISVESLQKTENGFYGPWLMYHRYRAPRELGNEQDEPAALVPGNLFADPLPPDQ
jgi:type II secretory pathway component PulK